MAFRFCLLVCVGGCGLTLDLDEPMDASTRDAVANDSGAIDSSADAGVDALESDVGVVDAGSPDAGDGAVEPFDAGADAMGCPAMCPSDTYCEGDRCVPFCDDNRDCDEELVCFVEFGFCGQPECEHGFDCVDPEGDGCTVPSCENGRCEFPPVEFDDRCQYCDPRSGEVLINDNDNDGFPPCVPICVDGPESCDCNDDNALINPDTLGELPPGTDLERICDGTVPLPSNLLFCLTDSDGDGTSVFRRSFEGTCDASEFVRLVDLIAELRRTGGPDCDDDDGDVFPLQEDFMSEGRDGCELPRRCFDYNCDRRQEREHPAFEYCERAFDEDECVDASGWQRQNSDDSVPACGADGRLTTCRWSPGDGCVVASTIELTQRCR